MEQIFKSILLLSCIGSFLTLILLLLKPITKKIFGSCWHYYIWICVLLICMLPIRFKMPIKTNVNIQSVKVIDATIPEIQTATTTQGMSAIINDKTPINPLNMSMTSGFIKSFFNISIYIWLFGVFFVFVGGLIRYLLFVHVLHKNSINTNCLTLEDLKFEKGIKRKIDIRISNYTTTPLMLGIFKSTLLLPNTKMSEDELRYVLLHELTHLKRQDLLYKWFAYFVNAIHWFNPFIYFTCHQINEECEISCDLAVTKDMNENEKNNYMNTILSLLCVNKQKGNLLTTAMVSNTKQLKRRFTMIKKTNKRNKFLSTISIITAMLIFSTSIFASGVLANNMVIYSNTASEIEVFNGDIRLKLTNKPFIQNDEVYLPLRETLSNFGVTDIRWDKGQINMTLPLAENYKGGTRQESGCSIIVGKAIIWYGEQIEANGYKLRYAPITKDGITYGTVELFENLVFHGQMPWFRVHLKQSSNPKDYYTEGEDVYIGTSKDQDKYRPVDENGKRRYVKRIVTNEHGEAMYVITVENQRSDVIASMNAVNSSSMQGYSKGSEGRSRTFYSNAQGAEIVFSSGIFVYERTGDNEFADIAYIPPALQINCCAYNHQYKLMD